MGTIAELQGKPDRLYPLLWLSNEGGSLEDNYKVDNIRLTMFGRVIAGEEGQDDDASEIEVLSDMQLILLDFLNYFHQQHGQEYVTDKAATLEHFTERTNDRTAGYSCVLELKQFYDWNKCQIPQSGASIPPSVDGLTLYDFCDQSVIDRLTAPQLACLAAEFGGGVVTEQINGVTIGTSTAGTTNDQQIHDSAGADIGTAANPSVVSDSTVQNNATPTWTDTVEAEGTLTLAQAKALDSDGATTLLADYIPSTDGFMFTCTPSTNPSLAVGVSTSTPNFGDTVTITATATGITATNYRFYVPDSRGRYTVVEQASNVYNWGVCFTGTYDIYIEAEDATDGLCEVGGVSITSTTGGLLEQYTGATCGFSTTGLTSGNAFPIMTIRRSSDNVENTFFQDSAHKLSMSSVDAYGVSLSTWIGSDSGYVARWYHQGTTAYFAFQSTAASQPRIVNAGTLDTVNGEPALWFDGSNDFLKTNTGTISQALTYFIVSKRAAASSDATTMTLISGSASAGRVQIFQFSSVYQMFAGSFLSSGQTTKNQVVTSAIFDGASSEYYQNAASLASGNVGSSSLSTDMEIGGQTNGVATWHGYIQEVILYPSDQTANRAAIETNINGRFLVY